MTISADTLRKLSALRLDPDQMAGVLDILADIQSADEERKVKQRDRVRRHRAKRDGNVTVTDQERYTPSSSPIPLDPPSQTLPPIIPQTPSPTRETKRATRLPADWVLPASWGQWAVSEGYPEQTIRLEAEKFRDFWISKSGKDAAKLDWQATWRNWMRNVSKTVRPHGQAPPREKTILDVLNERIQRADHDQHTIDGEFEPGAGNPSNLHFLADAAGRGR